MSIELETESGQIQNSQYTWPPPYKLKRSLRAKRMSLKISPLYGLQVVIPRWASEASIIDLLNGKRAWIEKHLSPVLALHAKHAIDQLPACIDLLALGQRWETQYLSTMNPKLRLMTHPGNQLVIIGNSDDRNLSFQLLKKWLRKQAKPYLTRELDRLSAMANMPYQRLTIRSQKTLWGSCTADNKISLNDKLIFLPPELAQHIMLHELCHTVHHNHSHHFWRLLAKLDPSWREHHRLTRRMEAHVPLWAL